MTKKISIDVNELAKADKSKLACWELARAAIPFSRRTLLSGPPGTGKTFAGQFLRDNDVPVYSITLTEDTPAAEVRGHFIPRGDDFVWHDGPAIRAWREGARLVVNEINRASPEVQTLLYAILDDIESAQLTLPTGETVMPAPGFTCVATMNGSPGELPEALLDRFPVNIHIDSVNPEAIDRLPAQLRGIATDTCNVTTKERVSIRAWLAFCNMLADGATTSVAGQSVFGKRWTKLSEAVAVAVLAADQSK